MMEKHNFPNIVVILTDDQGVWALGSAGNKDVKTPNLDRLAEEGTQFNSFFCTSPVCSPARASLLTGRIPSQHGIHDWLRHENERESSIEYLEGQLGYPDILAENGYVCGISGKWHMGNSMEPQKSFSHWYVHAQGGGPYYNAPMIRNGELVQEPGYITDLITDDGIEFIEKQSLQDHPFYLSVHYTAPHSPWINQHPKEYMDLYEDCTFESCPKNPEHPWSTTNYRDNHVENLKGYYASITAMDYNVGRIIDTLEELNIRENTLIWFLSDNGFNFGHHGIWGKGNGTFPQNLFDTSIKVPAIVSHIGEITQGVKCDELVSGYDFFPTLLDYIGLDNPVSEDLPGRSIAHILTGHNKDASSREHVVIYDEYGPVRMIRSKEFKYIHRYPYGPHEFYDLQKDPDETINLINNKNYELTIVEMRSQLESWFVSYVNPKIDGTKEAVKGAGQGDLAGIKRNSQKTYYEWDEWNE